MIDTVIHEGESKRVHVLEMDVGELPDLKNKKPHPDNVGIADRLRMVWGLREAREGEDPTPWDGSPKSFYLGRLKDIHSVDKRLEKGWKDGSEKALTLAAGLKDKISQPLSIRRKLRWSDDGDEFDRERLNDGHFDSCWRTTHREIAVAVPVITIAMSWGGNANTSHEQLFWSGAAALALCQVLEEAGYQTSLTAIAPTRYEYGSGKFQAMCVTVKRAGEYMRSDALASVICLGPTFRTYGFMGTYLCPWGIDDALGSHGNIEMLMPQIVEAGAMDSPQITLPDSRDRWSAKAAIVNALEQLRAANLAALPEVLR
jgi:hypothetical protein